VSPTHTTVHITNDCFSLSTPEGFDRWYDDRFEQAVRTLAAAIGDFGLAHECVQQAFVRAWAHRRTVARQVDPDTWLDLAARRLARAARR
jgi:DNA-directed RNA polymerase specialized sigma24 family protein